MRLSAISSSPAGGTSPCRRRSRLLAFVVLSLLTLLDALRISRRHRRNPHRQRDPEPHPPLDPVRPHPGRRHQPGSARTGCSASPRSSSKPADRPEPTKTKRCAARDPARASRGVARADPRHARAADTRSIGSQRRRATAGLRDGLAASAARRRVQLLAGGVRRPARRRPRRIGDALGFDPLSERSFGAACQCAPPRLADYVARAPGRRRHRRIATLLVLIGARHRSCPDCAARIRLPARPDRSRPAPPPRPPHPHRRDPADKTRPGGDRRHRAAARCDSAGAISSCRALPATKAARATMCSRPLARDDEIGAILAAARLAAAAGTPGWRQVSYELCRDFAAGDLRLCCCSLRWPRPASARRHRRSPSDCSAPCCLRWLAWKRTALRARRRPAAVSYGLVAPAAADAAVRPHPERRRHRELRVPTGSERRTSRWQSPAEAALADELSPLSAARTARAASRADAITASMEFPVNIERSVTGQPWRWRRPADRRSAWTRWSTSCCSLAAWRVTICAPPRARRSATSCPTRPAFATWTRVRNGSPMPSRRSETVAIFGDYDVDGATSAALLVLLLRRLGADPMVYIPDRLMEGYGPSGKALVELKDARRESGRLRRLRRAGLRGARGSAGGRTRRDRRRPSPVRDPAPRRASRSSIPTGSTKARRGRRMVISPRSAWRSCSASRLLA